MGIPFSVMRSDDRLPGRDGRPFRLSGDCWRMVCWRALVFSCVVWNNRLLSEAGAGMSSKMGLSSSIFTQVLKLSHPWSIPVDGSVVAGSGDGASSPQNWYSID